MSDEIEDEPTELVQPGSVRDAKTNLVDVPPKVASSASDLFEDGPEKISNLTQISETELADIQFENAKTMKPNEVSVVDLQRAKAMLQGEGGIEERPTIENLTADDKRPTFESAPQTIEELDATSIKRIDRFLSGLDEELDATSLRRVIEDGPGSTTEFQAFVDVETEAVPTAPTLGSAESDPTEFAPIEESVIDQTMMPSPIQVENLLQQFYPEEREFEETPDVSEILKLSEASEAVLQAAAMPQPKAAAEPPEENAEPFTLSELSAIGAGMSAAVVACSAFGILSAWPSRLSIFLASLGVVILFAGGVGYVSKNRFRAVVALAPTLLAIVIVGAWSLSDIRHTMLKNFPDLFLDSSIETAIRTEDGRIVAVGCSELDGRMNGANIIQSSIQARPEIAKICIEKIRDPQQKTKISGMLTNAWEAELLSGEFKTACRYLGHFEHLASIHENASLRLSSIALRVDSAPIRTCILDHLKKQYAEPEEMIAEWTEQLDDVSETTGRKFVRALIDAWRIERDDLKDTNFEPTDSMMNFRLKLACSYIREEGPGSDVVGWIPGILQQSEDGFCSTIVSPEAIAETCEDYRGKTVKTFCDTLVRDTVPFAVNEASSLIHRAIRWGLDPEPFQGYERAPTAYRNGASEAIANVRGSGAARMAKDELERQASEAFVYQNPDLSFLTTKLDDDEIDRGMDQAFAQMQDKTAEEIAAELGLNWDELTRAEKKKLKQLAEEIEMDPEKRKEIVKQLKKQKRKKRRGRKKR